MFINKFIGYRQSGKTTFLCNKGIAFLGEKPEDVTNQKKAGFPRLVQSYEEAIHKIGLFVVPTRREIPNIKKYFFTDLRMHIVCVDDIKAGAGMGRCYNILLIDNVDIIPQQDYDHILMLFNRVDTLCYVTINGEKE
jgi:hypothetical protein